MRAQFGVQQNRAILLVESHKSDPRPLDEGPRSKSGKIEINLHGTCFGGRINWSKLGSKPRFNSRIQFASTGSKFVHVNVDPAPSSKVCLCHWLSIRLFDDESPCKSCKAEQ